MPSKQPSTTTQISKVELPAWVDSASQSNYELAQQIASKPYTPYTGQTVAGTSPLLQQAQALLASGKMNNQTGFNQASTLFNKAGQGSAYTTSAADIFKGLTKPSQYTTDANALFQQAGKGINGLNRDDYMNPFQKDVIDSTVTSSMDALSQSLMGNADKAVAAKAFGGDRGAIVDAVTRSQSNKDLSALIASLNSQNYNQATGAMQGDISNMMSAGQGLAGLGSADTAARTAAGQGLAGLGSQEVNNWLSAASGLSSNQSSANHDTLAQVSGLLTAGTQDQAHLQSLLDADRAAFDEAQGYDLNRLNVLLSSLGMSPYGQSQTTQTTQKGGSSGVDIGSLGMGFLSLLMGVSDERLKKNKKKVGTKIVKGKKVPIYKYNYISDPPGTPKTKGPMAQDVEKVLPHSVANVGGIKMVDNRVLGALAR